MKTASKQLGLLVRLGLCTASLLISQHAIAAGTDPGVTISNTATIDYEVNGAGQPTETSNAADFLVDRRVDFTVTRLGSALTPTDVGDTGVFLDFLVSNVSNGTLDFNLAFAQLITADGDIHAVGTADTGTTTGGGGDDVDMNNVTISVSAAADTVFGSADGPDPAFGGPTSIDDLAEDSSIRVRLYADTPGDLANLDIAGLRLLATAAAPNAVPLPGDPAEGVNLVEDTGAENPAEVDNVFANASGADASNNATESERDGFIVSSADLTVAKAAVVTDDGFGTAAPNAKAIPGATVEYSITLDNTTGAVDVTNLSISDTIQVAEVALVELVAGEATITLTPSVGAPTTCVAETNGTDGNTDGCVFDETPDVLRVSGLTVPAGQSLVVSFEVNIL